MVDFLALGWGIVCGGGLVVFARPITKWTMNHKKQTSLSGPGSWPHRQSSSSGAYLAPDSSRSDSVPLH